MTAPHRGFSGPMKQSTKQQNTTTTTVKNPNWPEANQLAIYKCSWEVAPGTTRNKFSEWSELVLNPGSPDLKASALTTGPHCLLNPVNIGGRVPSLLRHPWSPIITSLMITTLFVTALLNLGLLRKSNTNNGGNQWTQQTLDVSNTSDDKKQINLLCRWKTNKKPRKRKLLPWKFSPLLRSVGNAVRDWRKDYLCWVSVFTWHHGRHISVPAQYSGNWTICYDANVFFCFRWKTWLLITWVTTKNCCQPNDFPDVFSSKRHPRLYDFQLSLKALHVRVLWLKHYTGISTWC